MNHTLDVFEGFSSATNVDDLWLKYKHVLSRFGVSTAMYCVSHSPTALKEDGVIDSAWYKGDHPDEYLNYFDEKFNFNDDPTAMHCLEKTAPYIWHDPEKVSSQTEAQKEFMIDSVEFGMGVGVTLPIRFNEYGVGGIGLSTEGVTEKEFDKIWLAHGQEIVLMSRWFDEFARGEKIDGVYSLSDREREVLTWLAIGRKTEEIAKILGTAVSTVEKQIRSARKKLNARNNEQAIAKALIFKLIRP